MKQRAVRVRCIVTAINLLDRGAWSIATAGRIEVRVELRTLQRKSAARAPQVERA